jgi:hypothetical protein
VPDILLVVPDGRILVPGKHIQYSVALHTLTVALGDQSHAPVKYIHRPVALHTSPVVPNFVAPVDPAAELQP